VPRYATAAIAVLGIATIGLAVALGVVLAANDNDDDSNHSMGAGYPGMMRAIGTMDASAMLERMREVLGDEGYQAMLDHMQDHRDGTAGATPPGIDGMMHQMMDGMMSSMSPDASGHMFPNNQMPMSGMPGRN